MILCCGEALIDMIPATTAERRTCLVPHSGGAIFNTAIALGRLGEETGMLTALSHDLFGAQLMADLAASGVNTDYVLRVDRPATLAFVDLKDGHATYTFYDENSAGRMVEADDFPPLAPDVSALYFGGISLACEPGADAYAALLGTYSQDRVIMIDPNIRPSFVSDEARYRARLAKMISQSDILKISDEDLNWLDPAPLTLSEKVSRLLDTGPALVILTRGSQGAVGALANGEQVAVPAQQAQVVDTVGAGDTFNAGVLAKLAEMGLLRKSSLSALSPAAVAEALHHGARVAAITVSRAGANPPWKREIDDDRS